MPISTKSLRIMDPIHNYKQNSIQDSLMSPPLTPTEPYHSTSHWDCLPRKRKDFIQSYSRMVPFLRNTNDTNGSIFALNVYRDLIEIKNTASSQDNKGNHYKINTTNDCAMSDETVVAHSQKRKLSSSSFNDGDNNKKMNPKKKRVSSVLPTGKEAALAFDALDIVSDDHDFYPPGWVPNANALDYIPVKVCWKGAPLSIEQQPYYHILHEVEASMASTLRLSPVQYLRCKRTLIMAARTLQLQQIPFTKSVAQKLCRVDVNKTSALWTAFGQLGWFNESHAYN